MKNHIKWLGIIVFAAVIGLSFAACGGNEPEKTISITGIPTEYLTATEYHFYVADDKIVAMGNGQLSGSIVTFDLYIAKETSENYYSQTNDRWTGKGTFRVGFSIKIGENWKNGNAQAISITDAVTTIQFSKFQVN